MLLFQSRNPSAKALRKLKKSARLDGIAMICNGILLYDDCPRGSDSKLFSQSVVRLSAGLAAKGEHANDIFMKFDGGNVLMQFRHSLILCLFTNREADLVPVETKGSAFLAEYGEKLAGTVPEPKTKGRSKKSGAQVRPVRPVTTGLVLHRDAPNYEAWETYRSEIVAIFSKVLGTAHARKLLKRELVAMGLEKNGFLAMSQFRSFGEKLCQRIRDKRIRRQIENELFTTLDKLI